MAIDYPNQKTINLIGTSSSLATLTAAYAGNTKSFATAGMAEIMLYVKYVATDATNVIEIKVDRSADKTNWFQEVQEKNNGSTAIGELHEHQFDSTAGGTDMYSIPIPVANKYTRVSVKETVNGGSAGTIWISTEISGK